MDNIGKRLSSLNDGQVRAAYQYIFANQTGRIVLEDLKRAGFHYKDAVTESLNPNTGAVDTGKVLFINGQQAVIKYILAMIGGGTSDFVPGMEPGADNGIPSKQGV